MEQYIKDLIYLKLTQGLTPQEQQVLDEWANQSAAHRAYYERLMNDTRFVERYGRYSHIDEEAAFRKFSERHGLLPQRRRASLWKYAAILLLPLLVAGGLWVYHYSARTDLPDEVAQLMLQSEQCGKSQATLITEQGEEIVLQKRQQKIEYKVKASANPKAADSLTHHEAQAHPVQTLKTHADSEFWITLEDGTSVHLNYNTTLAYPIHFNNHQRTVYLEGEAYFIVKKENDRPFRVITPHGTVKEYGTSFNVNTFSADCTKVVLVEGSIGVTPKEGHEQLMRPGQLAVMTESSPVATIEQVNVDAYVAWNQGRFVFEDCSLKELMQVVANWYGVGLDFRCEACAETRFTGDMDRYGSLESVLKAISKATSLKMELRNNTIIVTSVIY